MKIVDANVVLRYLLADVQHLFMKSKELLEHETIYLPFEVLAEIVYVLEKVYTVTRKEISGSLINLLKYQNISTYDSEIAIYAMKAFSDTKLDFIDTLLSAYKKVRNFEIVSYDKKLIKYIEMN